jgi:hypothetical protein
MFWAPGSIWKVFQLVRAVFEKFGAGPVSWGGLTAWCRQSNRPGQAEQNFALCCIHMLHCCIVSGGVCFGSRELTYVQGELFVLFELWFGGLFSLLEHGFVSDVSSCCPCLRGPRFVLLQVILLFAFFWLSITCWSFFLFVSFLFLFSRVTICVCCQCTHQGGD